MALSDDIQTLRDRTLADLIAAHDYHADTVVAWDLVQKNVDAGRQFTNKNAITGTVRTQTELADKSLRYLTIQLPEATFQQFIAIFESFFFDLLRLWLKSFPQNLIGKKVDIRTVLDSPDKDAIILSAVNKELNEILYERPAGWFAFLDEKVKLGCPSADEIERIAEAKATRDVLVHNQGIVGKAYETKTGQFARAKIGERIEIAESYHRLTWELLCKVVADVSNAGLAKVS